MAIKRIDVNGAPVAFVRGKGYFSDEQKMQIQFALNELERARSMPREQYYQSLREKLDANLRRK